MIQLIDEHHRVKYFRAGWKQPIALGPRGTRGDSLQQFDEGGEASVNEGSRLFFPGALEYEGQCESAEKFGEAWHGGKASLLYEALSQHWKTKKTGPLLERTVQSALADQPNVDVGGMAFVTGL